jgi:hypothetical protein
MTSLSLWHWIIVLLMLGIPAIFLGLLIWFIVRAATKSGRTTESRLQELANLKSKGLVSEAEYEQQRSSIVQGV